jgi:hypothetical protein
MAATYFVTLNHLAPGARAAGLAYPPLELPNQSLSQLQELLRALEELAGRLNMFEPAAPEMRIKSDRETFVIRTRNRGLCFIGWEPTLRGEEHTVEFILATISGNADIARALPRAEVVPVERTRTNATPTERAPAAKPRRLKFIILGVAILAINGVTAWMLFRPAPSYAPQHQVLADAESRALLAKTAGVYVTGTAEGDRRVEILPDGTLKLAKLGTKGALLEERQKTVRGGLSNGRAALITSDPYVMEIRDANTVVLYGTTYRREQSQ